MKVECGWGREKQRSDWDVDCRVTGGRLHGLDRCFRHSIYPMDESESTERVLEQDSERVRWRARALANPSGMVGGTHFNAGGTQAVILDLEAGADCRLRVRTAGVEWDLSLEDLVAESVGQQVDGFGSPAIKIHRAIPEQAFTLTHHEDYRPPGGAESGFVYARVIQSDGQMAWISPIWYE